MQRGKACRSRSPDSSALLHTVLYVRGRTQAPRVRVLTAPGLGTVSSFCILTHSTLTITLWDMMTTVVVVIILNCGCYYYD